MISRIEMVHFGMRPERTTSNPIYSHSSTPLPRPSPTSLGSYQIQKATPHVVDSILPQCCVLMLLARGDIGRPPSISLDRPLQCIDLPLLRTPLGDAFY